MWPTSSSTPDVETYKRLYEQGWRPDFVTLRSLCRIMPPDFLLAHESATEIASALLSLWHCGDHHTLERFRNFLPREEWENVIGKILRDNKEFLQRTPWWSCGDYLGISHLAKLGIEFPGWLLEEATKDIGHVEEYKSRPRSSLSLRFIGCLIMLAEFKRFGRLPEVLERRARNAANRIYRTVIERAAMSRSLEDYFEKGLMTSVDSDPLEVVRAVMEFVDEKARVEMIATLLKTL